MPSSRFAHRLAALALSAVALPAMAQTAPVHLEPGSPDLTEVPPQSFEYEVRIAGDVPRLIGRMRYAETIDGDRLVIVTHREIVAAGEDRRDTTVVAWPGLAPQMRSADDGEEHSRVTVTGGRIVGRSVLGNLDEALDAPLPTGAFGEGVAARLARALPFVDGYRATFRVADKRGDTRTDTLHVAGPVAVARPDGTEARAWQVTHVAPGEPARTYTVDATTRELLSVSFIGGRMPTGQEMTVEIAPPAPPPSGLVLRPGDPSLITDWMTDDEASFVIRVVEPMQMDAGTSTMRRTVSGGEVTSEMTVSVPMQQMQVTTVSRAEAGTLAPRAHTTTGGPEAQALTFTPTAVTGTTTSADGEATAIDVALAAPVFDASMAGQIAQSLPFAEGYTATAEAYDATLGVHAITFRVTGQTEVDGAAAWTVEAASPAGPVTYVVDAATRRLVSMRMSPQPGMVVEMGQP